MVGDKTRALPLVKDERHVSPSFIDYMGISEDCERLKA
jgi:hypothetical protein